MRSGEFWRFLAVSLLFCHCAPSYAQEAPLELEHTVALPDVKGRIDHLTLDASGAHLWIAALENDSIEIVDLDAMKRIQTLTGPKEPQGICLIPELKRIVVASGEDGIVRAYDDALKVVASVSGLEDADNVRYDPGQKRIYVGYGKGALAVLDADKLTKLADVKLDGHPESFQLEQHGERIFVNVPSAKYVAVIDRKQQSVTTKWPISEAQSNYPMALDEAHKRLLLVCRKPARLLVLSTESGKVVANLDCCGDADDIFLDPGRKRVYVTGGDGSVSTFEQADADHYQPLPRVSTRDGARTSLYDPKTGRLFVALPSRGGAEAELRVFQARP